jgi:hypothetical protein
VVEEQRRQDAIERAVGVWELTGQALVELDQPPGLGRLASRQLEDLRVGIEAGHLGVRLAVLRHDRQRSRAATEVKDPLTRPEVGGVNQRRLEG